MIKEFIQSIRIKLKPKYKVGDKIKYIGILYTDTKESKELPLANYEGIIESVHGNWISGFWYTVNKPEGTLCRQAVFESRIK